MIVCRQKTLLADFIKIPEDQKNPMKINNVFW